MPETTRTPPRRGAVRSLFVRGLGLVYVVAFASLLVQARGLFGRRGILPASEVLEAAREVFGSAAPVHVPTLFLAVGAGDGVLVATCLVGLAAASLLVFDRAAALAAIVAYAAYLSFVAIGRDFLSLQWDALLLEVGFLGVFVSPPHLGRTDGAEPPALVVVLLRFLVFRFMLASGIVKLASGDPTWRDLSALSFHYETTCLPTFTGYFAHRLPERVHQASGAMMFVIELVLPFGCFGPRRLRRTALGGFVLLQLAIGSTGNYGFFNVLVVVLCLVLLDDDDLPAWARARMPSGGRAMRRLPRWVPIGLALVLVPLGTIHLTRSFGGAHVFPDVALRASDRIAPFRIASPYGLFAVMTTHRPEITLEATADGATWAPYVFRYKPGPLSRRPRFVEPHMPRLDWQMWFAALGSAERSRFFIPLVHGLLEARPEVLALLAEAPLGTKRPARIRAWLDVYRFTTPRERASTGRWWTRERVGEYLPEVALDARGQLVRASR